MYRLHFLFGKYQRQARTALGTFYVFKPWQFLTKHLTIEKYYRQVQIFGATWFL
jgi:hypothetical protein